MSHTRKYLARLCLVAALSALAAAGALAQPKASDESAKAAIERMRVLSGEDKSQEIVDQFKDTDFTGWPQAADAYFYRGRSYLLLRDADKAERDLRMSVKLNPDEGWFWYNLGEMYRQLKRNNARAAEAYTKACKLEEKAGWMPADAALKAADILLHQVKTEEAMEVLNLYDDKTLEQTSTFWHVRIMRARGQVLAAQGKEQEAWAAFRKALAVERGT